MCSIERRLGSKITEIRLSQKLTQSRLAEKVNVSVETISRMERGVSFPSIKTLENIAMSLKVPLKNFFEFNDDQPRDQLTERELAKLTAFLRTLDRKDLTLIHEILKVVFKKVG